MSAPPREPSAFPAPLWRTLPARPASLAAPHRALLRQGRQKEPHFFDWKWDEVQRLKLTSAQAKLAYTWFTGSQPNDGLKRKYALVFNTQALAKDRSLVTGEGTPSYLLGGTALARRVQAVASNAHLVVCLRDPVKRAYSHYQMVVDPEGTPAQKVRATGAR